MNIVTHRRTLQLLIVFAVAALTLAASHKTAAQTINIDRVVADLEPEIQRVLLEGRIPSAAIALIAGDRVDASGAYGHSNLWARTPATSSTVYLIGSPL